MLRIVITVTVVVEATAVLRLRAEPVDEVISLRATRRYRAAEGVIDIFRHRGLGRRIQIAHDVAVAVIHRSAR